MAGPTAPRPTLPKSPTGIVGLDLITGGGLPKERTTLVCGVAGAGKTMLALEFLVRGATEFDEPGLFVAFEESAEELAANVASLGFDLPGLVAANALRLDEVRLDPDELQATGAYDLEGLFIRLGHAIDSIGAKRVAFDTVEVLFAGLPDPALLRAELRRLFRWLKDRGVTAVVTAERSDGALTRHGIEEFVSDCVIVLEHDVQRQSSVRRLRIAKYRGSAHGTDEYPFLIDANGISVVPLTEVGLDYEVSDELVSTGVADLNAMLGGGGVFRGSSVLVSGTAGTGKTSIAASFADAACGRGERCVYFSFEESPSQIVRDLASIGLDLQRWIDLDLLRIRSARPTGFGLEMHLSRMQRVLEEFEPTVVVVDPITTFDAIADARGIASMITRLMDVCRGRGITSVFVSLNAGGSPLESTDAAISSVADVWLLLRDLESDGERNRALYLLKARGMAHSNQVREFVLGDDGIKLVPVYVDADGVKTGSARVVSEARTRLDHLARHHQVERARLDLELQRTRHEAAIAALQADFAAEEARSRMVIEQAEAAAAAQSVDQRETRLPGASFTDEET
jgi:circadian clock protein KaiC